MHKTEAHNQLIQTLISVWGIDPSIDYHITITDDDDTTDFTNQNMRINPSQVRYTYDQYYQLTGESLDPELVIDTLME